MQQGTDVEKSAAHDAGTMAAREALDAWVREMVAWHFDPASGCPFWLDYAKQLGWDPRREIQGFADLRRLDRLRAGLGARLGAVLDRRGLLVLGSGLASRRYDQQADRDHDCAHTVRSFHSMNGPQAGSRTSPPE